MFFLLFIFNLCGQDIVIQAEQTTSMEYEKYLVGHPTKRSYVQYHKAQKNFLSEKLYGSLKAAQFEFLNGSLDKARQLYQQVGEFKFKADWKTKERKAIHYSLLRVAQLEKDSKKQKQWLKQAFEFSFDAKVDKILFPPPLVQAYEKIKNQQINNVWKLPINSEKFDTILINGKELTGKTGFLKTVPGTQRFTFVSNQYQSVHFITEPDKLTGINLPLTPLASGPCEHPIFHENLTSPTSFVYLVGECQGRVDQNLQSLNIANIKNKTINKQPRFPRFLESKWFWIGVSTLATAVVISEQQNNRRGFTPANNSPPPVQTFSNQ